LESYIRLHAPSWVRSDLCRYWLASHECQRLRQYSGENAVAQRFSPTSRLLQGSTRFPTARNNNAPSKRGVECSGADYFLAAGAAGASALAGSLMASSSRSNTSTELAGIAGLGLWAP